MTEETSLVENPFNAPQYKDVQMNDDPLPFAGNMLDSMLNNDEVDDEIKSKWWMVFHKDNVLGFLDKERKQEKLLNFDIMKSDMIFTMPRKGFKFSTMLEFDTMRNVFETKLDRSVGINNASSVMNERKSLISQISENRNVSESDDSLVKESFIRKLMGKAKR